MGDTLTHLLYFLVSRWRDDVGLMAWEAVGEFFKNLSVSFWRRLMVT